MTADEYETVYLPRYDSVIQAIARKNAYGDEDLFDDLVAVGRIRLFTCDLSRAESNPDAYLRKAIRYAIIEELRKTKPLVAGRARFESLDARLDRGHQVTRDRAAGAAVVIAAPRGRWGTRQASHGDTPDEPDEVQARRRHAFTLRRTAAAAAADAAVA